MAQLKKFTLHRGPTIQTKMFVTTYIIHKPTKWTFDKRQFHNSFSFQTAYLCNYCH